ncbi:Reverse transcriptase (RNA-dependent DNA polymerase) [Sulfitobacter marinus]|jgi:RNA-directed DNA polymerase|uniref:Reverse transcriptase (RNA-dependent DNA polymerase) n=1 Tax=Sulfitobacter marinus TaxID=394264 RepID=A0A1I6PM36_9RHOB|nr:reverse transcriptase domain-containing protein [Sulfitobacter marinus]SFS41246.1 Reverse transcriptase (RNA-dependent DNA polymerase) [Sulfitobacter marinus]
MGDLFKAVRAESNMFAAWRHVKRSALSSANMEIKGAASVFEHQHQRYIKRFIRQLQQGTFEFDAVQGVLADKKERERANKDPRPIAIATLKNRVVQRAILQILQPRKPRDVKEVDGRFETTVNPALGKINDVNSSAYGVGGLIKPYGGVGRGIDAIMSAMNHGATLFYRSDIKAFFTDIPVAPVIEFVRKETGDDKLADLFALGLEVHLGNEDELRGYAHLFPSNGHGVAQGSSLSAFAGNVLLYDMDHEINALGVTGIRYIDDIMIVADTQGKLDAAVALAQLKLKNLGFTLYEPINGSDKAETGRCSDSFGFLGCTLHPKKCVPSAASVKRILADAEDTFSKSQNTIKRFKEKGGSFHSQQSPSSVLHTLGKKLYGWQKSFAFCDDVTIFEHVDERIAKRVEKYNQIVARHTRGLSLSQKATVYGLPSTVEMFFASRRYDPNS